ncbi:LysR family transcriptional regulator [Flavonifractor sp. An100]|uniref:LysR family transcriptional regulator n=1 Tax=Flavonifractor sp. An100 TaxID=1965538 RepID=UPI000B37DC8B|nr:LysR family transcriptional regulator [Flavonifractor sp. An100]OUQ78931.1 transcriptional regulator [Flavonifractor sp. An100]
MLDYKEYIYAIYQERSFSKAARKLHVSQPWLSAAVKKVEQELKLPLFDRNTKPISLTPAGEYYIRQVERILAIEGEMRQTFAEMSASRSTALHIGSSMFFCTYVLPSLLSEFRQQNPQVSITLTEGTTPTLADQLLEGKLDFLLEAGPPDDKGLTSVVWAQEELVLAVPADYPVNRDLADYAYTFNQFLSREQPGHRKPSVPLIAFRQAPFMVLKQGNDSYSRTQALCRNAGFIPNVSLYLTQMMTAYYLVCEGRGVTFLRSTIPQYVAPTDSVIFYTLDDPLVTRSIHLSYRSKSSSPVQQDLIDYMLHKGPAGLLV